MSEWKWGARPRRAGKAKANPTTRPSAASARWVIPPEKVAAIISTAGTISRSSSFHTARWSSTQASKSLRSRAGRVEIPSLIGKRRVYQSPFVL